MARSRPTVAIVGAGPAGSSAAFVTASHGLRTILIDRAHFPREKVCGEGCTPRAVQNLSRMGVLPELEPFAAQVTQAFLVSPGGVELFTELPESICGGRILVVPRTTLDQRLVQRALRAGAELREDTRVEHVDISPQRARLGFGNGESLDADVLIGCDGIPSLVRRAVGAPAFRQTPNGLCHPGDLRRCEAAARACLDPALGTQRAAGLWLAFFPCRRAGPMSGSAFGWTSYAPVGRA